MRNTKKINFQNNNNKKLQNLIENLYQRFNNEERKILLECSLLDNHHISKSLIIKIRNNSIAAINSMYKINEFSLISNIEAKTYSPKEAIFEMHDLIKTSIFNITDENEIRDNLNEIIQSTNNIIPSDVSKVNLVLKQYPYLTENLEKLLENSNKYQVSLLDIMELQKNLLILYFQKLDYKKSALIIDWLAKEEHNLALLINSADFRYKAAYIWLCIYRGIYYDFALGSAQDAISNFKDAIAKLEELLLPGNFNLKFMAYAQFAQTLAYAGNIEKAQEVLIKA